PPGRAGVVRTIEPRRAGTDALRDDAASAELRRLRARRFLGSARRTWCSAPRLCRGFGTRSAAAATAPRALFRRSLNQRINDVRAPAIDVEGDAAERSFRKIGLQACPVFAAVRGFPDTA